MEPVVVGLDPATAEPFIGSMDLIGCPTTPEDFVVAGSCTEQLYGMCESLWAENMVCQVLYSSNTRNLFREEVLSNASFTVQHEFVLLIFVIF